MDELTPRPPNYQDFVIRDGNLVGDWEGLYSSFEDPWHQSRLDHIFDTRRQIAILNCQKLNSIYGNLKVLELGCGFGFLTDRLRKKGFETLGIDISQTAIGKASAMHPLSNFEMQDYNNFDTYYRFNPDIIIMAEITWYILESLEQYLLDLKKYAISRSKPTFLIHLLATYKQGTQKYGLEKFTNHEEILEYFGLSYLESGFIATQREDDKESQGTFFVAEIKG
jgi:predicted TPR repeat methyltransferase